MRYVLLDINFQDLILPSESHLSVEIESASYDWMENWGWGWSIVHRTIKTEYFKLQTRNKENETSIYR